MNCGPPSNERGVTALFTPACRPMARNPWVFTALLTSLSNFSLDTSGLIAAVDLQASNYIIINH